MARFIRNKSNIYKTIIMSVFNKIKELFKKRVKQKLFLLVRWENHEPKIIKSSNNSNMLYRMLDFDKGEDVLTKEEYESLQK